MVYKYISLDKDDSVNDNKIKTIENNQVFLSTTDNFNDPYDTKAIFYDNDRLKLCAKNFNFEFKINDDLSESMRIACFTGNGENYMPMWGNYASNHSGFCVSYNTRDQNNIELNSNLLPVEYTEERIDITSLLEGQLEEVSRIKSDSNLIKVLSLMAIYFNCLKHASWESENEYRCLLFEKCPGIPYVTAKPAEIFIGSKCEEKYEKELINIGHTNCIPVYKMRFEKNSVEYELKKDIV